MSLDPSQIDFNIINFEAIEAPIPLQSGVWEGTGEQLLTLLGETVKIAIVNAANATLIELIPAVAKLTGQTRNAITNMFQTQVNSISGFENFTIDFSRPLLEIPHYLKYHDIEWELNPKFVNGYRNPTTLGTKPFSEIEFMLQLKVRFARNLIIEFIANGFDYSVEGLAQDVF